MKITKVLKDKELTVGLSGRLDTLTSEKFDTEVIKNLDDVDRLVLDFEELEYISSSGLRLLLVAQKLMSKKNGMKVLKVNKNILEIFDITGFSSILDIE